jgi:hypothetical protein
MLEQSNENKLIEGEDFYFTPEGYKCFTEKHHLKRGYCCKSGCRHCPYGYDKKTGGFKKGDRRRRIGEGGRQKADWRLEKGESRL